MEIQKKTHEQHPFIFAADTGVRWDVSPSDERITHLATYLSSFIEQPVQIIRIENYEDVLRGLEAGDIDAAKLGPYAFAQAQSRFGARALAHTVEMASGEKQPIPYRSLIVTRSDSNVTHLSQLRQQRFGFVNPHSTTGYLAATFLLQQAGIDATTDLTPVFLRSHRAVAEAVLQRQVAAGAIMEEEFLLTLRETTAAPLSLRLLATSPLLSRGPITVRSDMPTTLEHKLLAALEQLHLKAPDCAPLLLSPTERFGPAVQRERTLKTIAELAGVSYATVSRAINGRGRISPATSTRILRLVEELGYRPNANARSLHKSRGDTVGLLLPNLSFPHLDAIVAGIQTALDEAGMHLLICPLGPLTDAQHSRQRAYLDMLSNSRFEGVILTQWSALDATALEMLVRNGYPYVFLEQELLREGLSVAYNWLAQRGCSQICLVVGPSSLLELGMLRQFCEQSSKPFFRLIEINGADYTPLLNLLYDTNTPEAFLCTDDMMALLVRQALPSGYTQLPVIGLGNSVIAQQASLPSLAFDGAGLGEMVAQRLLKMLNLPTTPLQDRALFWVIERM